MARKKPARNTLQGDINITGGDFVAGDKNILPGETPASQPNAVTRTKEQSLGEAMDVSGGDVVFGNKVIKFFQDTLNIYLFKDIWQLLLFLVFLTVLGTAVGGAAWYLKQPKKMTGDYNIAVAKFGEVKPDGSLKPSAKATEFSNLVTDVLDQESSSLGFNIQVSNTNMPLITGPEADQLARKVGADLVIYGRIAPVGSQYRLTPGFYVAERPATAELTGRSDLGQSIPLDPSDQASQDQAESAIKARTEVLLNFIKSLVYLSQNNREAALDRVRASLQAAEQSSYPGREVIYLLAANIYAQDKNYDQANAMLDKALEINPSYARAYLARGNMLYNQSHGAADEEALLEKALDQYRQAYEMPDQPEGAYIPIKAKISMGNALVALAQGKSNDPQMLGQAAGYYTDVLGQLNDKDLQEHPFLRIYAYTAHYGLGTVHLLLVEKEAAVQEYQKAFDLADTPAQKSAVESLLQTAQSK